MYFYNDWKQKNSITNYDNKDQLILVYAKNCKKYIFAIKKIFPMPLLFIICCG